MNAKGACIGPMGSRVRAVMSELHGEKIDIVDYSEDPAEFVGNALSPAKVARSRWSTPANRSARVIVPDYQLSLAIGKEGQNARLAARLTGWRIDIRSDARSRHGQPATRTLGVRQEPGATRRWSGGVSLPQVARQASAAHPHVPSAPASAAGSGRQPPSCFGSSRSSGPASEVSSRPDPARRLPGRGASLHPDRVVSPSRSGGAPSGARCV